MPKKPQTYRADESPGVTGTELFRPPPPLEPADQTILDALCRPVLDGDAFTPPATPDEIAAQVGLAESVVTSRLERLCGAFEVDDVPNLAMEAIRRGAARP
ncbi:MAG: hypothetical protein ABR548_05845 [Actinomycetota bacterium]|nr:AsnC family protein [Actinomycetota bacterium]